MSRLLAVDPGLANTALVLFDGKRITWARTITTAAEGSRPDFTAAVARCRRIAAAIETAHLELGDVDEVVIETYRDIPGRLRTVSNRWTTPLAIGLMLPALEAFGPVAWQDPETVMSAMRDTVTYWSLGQRHLALGDHLLTNAHLRSAGAHGLYRLYHARRVAS